MVLLAPLIVKINAPVALLVMPPDPDIEATVLLNPPKSNVPAMLKSVAEGKAVAMPSLSFEPEPIVVVPP